MSDQYIVRYATKSGHKYLQSKPLKWGAAIYKWNALEKQRLDGQLPWVKHFEVRSAEDPTNPQRFAPTRPHHPRSVDHPANVRHSYNIVADQKVRTFQCIDCGLVYQGSGLAVGSHRRACPA